MIFIPAVLYLNLSEDINKIVIDFKRKSEI